MINITKWHNLEQPALALTVSPLKLPWGFRILKAELVDCLTQWVSVLITGPCHSLSLWEAVKQVGCQKSGLLLKQSGDREEAHQCNLRKMVVSNCITL